MIVAVVALDGVERVVGIDMFYANKRDVIERTIHEGYVCVSEDMAGKGIGTHMRELAIEHFRRNGLSGISSRISLNNLASLRVAEKSGFAPVEKYYDDEMREERYYLIRDFCSGKRYLT